MVSSELQRSSKRGPTTGGFQAGLSKPISSLLSRHFWDKMPRRIKLHHMLQKY